MSCWVEYWDKERCLATVVTSYIPKKDDWIKIKTKRMKALKMYKIIDIIHTINTEDTINEKFYVSVWSEK